MSAILCGKRYSFEELSASSPPFSKRIRISSSPVRFSSPKLLLVDQLVAIFPDMDKQLVERVLEECGDDLDSAIRGLNELRLASAEKNVDSAVNQSRVNVETTEPQETAIANVDSSASNTLTMSGTEWVELFVKEMMSASDVNDAKARAARSLEVFEKSIHATASAEATQENMILKQQLEALINENTSLKRTVAKQDLRQKECGDQSQELRHLKLLSAQYREQLRTLEVNNYALTLHLKQTQQNSSIPGRFHPDVF